MVRANALANLVGWKVDSSEVSNMKLRYEIIAAALPAELTEEQLARAEKELNFQVAMEGTKGASLTVRGAKKQHLITLRHRQRALMATMARVMLIDEVEEQARRKMDRLIAEIDERSDDKP